MADGDAQAAPVAAVSVKLTEFYPAPACLWFRQAVANFALANVTADGTKYY